MKFSVGMKCPDALDMAIKEAVDAQPYGSPKEELADKAVVIAAKWFRHLEYLTVEIDTDAETCTVMAAK